MSSSREVSNAVGAAPGEETATELLTQKRAALDAARERYAIAKTMRDEIAMSEEGRVIDALRTIILELEAEAAGEREVDARAAAARRIVGISRAAGSVAASIEDDDARVFAAAEAYAAAVTQLNERYRQLEGLAAESRALVDRFSVEGSKIPTVTPPEGCDGVVAAVRAVSALRYAGYDTRRPSFEEDESGLRRTRRTYEEIAGTEAYRIIASVGLKPFPPLTARQQEAVAAVEAEREQLATDPALGVERQIIAALPKGESALTAGIHRG